MSTLPTLQVENVSDSMRILSVDNSDLTRNKPFTYLNEDVVATGTTIRVQSLVGFESLTTSSGQIVCIGQVGNEKSELKRTSENTALSTTYNQITLQSAMGFDHPQDTPITIVDWNRLDFQYAPLATGTKVTLSAYPVAIQVDSKQTRFRDILEMPARLGQSTAFYFVRRNDIITDRDSSFSDPVSYLGHPNNSVFSIKKRALEALGESVDGKLITHEFLDQSLWEARREYHESPGKRPFRRLYNSAIGFVVTGSYRIDLPDSVERPYSEENIFGVRIGTNPNMILQSKKEWDFDFRSKPHSQLDHAYVSDNVSANASTSIWLANGRDFADSAVITVEGTSIGLSRVLGETGSFYIYEHGSYNASIGSDVFANTVPGLPFKFAVWAEPGGGSAYIYFNTPIATAHVGQNIFVDFYRTLPGSDSDGDILDEPDYDMYVDYLKAQIKHRKNKGESNLINDSDYKIFQFKKTTALNKEYIGVPIHLEPDVGHLPASHFGTSRSRGIY